MGKLKFRPSWRAIHAKVGPGCQLAALAGINRIVPSSYLSCKCSRCRRRFSGLVSQRAIRNFWICLSRISAAYRLEYDDRGADFREPLSRQLPGKRKIRERWDQTADAPITNPPGFRRAGNVVES